MNEKQSPKAGERTQKHFFVRGDVAMVKNTTLGGETINEGEATVLKRLDTDNRYLVQFHADDSKVERFLNPGDQVMLVGKLGRDC